jgi:Carbohydrate esterase, sialic acid-specific acetylesterase
MHMTRLLPINLRASKLVSAFFFTAIIAACGGASEPQEISAASAAPTPLTPTPAQLTPPVPPAPVAPVTASNGKLKIFILAGQSNMEGYGKVDRGGDPERAKIVCPLRADGTRGYPANILGGMGSLRAMVNADPVNYSYLVDPRKTISYTVTADVLGCTKADTKSYSSWATRDDVYVANLSSRALNDDTVNRPGYLSVGFGVDNQMRNGEGYIGPEFGFGHIVGKGLDDKVLLIKTSWGGKSLAVDFRPPSSVGLGVGSPASTTIPDQTGAYYADMVRKVKVVLSDIKKYYPDYDGKGYEVVGFGWHQGWNDRIDTSYVAQYEVNLANLIRDLRKDLNVPDMLVVIGNTGLAWAGKDKSSLDLINAQASVADPIKYPKFAGNVSTVDTRSFHYPDTSPEIGFVHHWNYSGESYFKVGESMGTAMLKLMKP